MVNGPKDFWNMNGNTFIIFIDNCEGSLVEKSLS